MSDEPVTIPLSDHERALLTRILSHAINLLAKKLLERGMSRKVVVRAAAETLEELFPGTKVVDVRTMLENPDAGA